MVRTKLTRLLYFVGAGSVCTVGINKYREIERNSMIQKQQQQQLVEPPLDNRSNAVYKGRETVWRSRHCGGSEQQFVDITLKHFPAPTALERRRLMADTNHCQFQSSFRNWIAQQHQDLEELLCGLSTDSATDNEKLKLLVEKSIQHFEEYSEKRALMVQHDAPSFLSPSWCSPFENALLWIGGCRPSLCIRLVYSVGGSELNDHLSGFLLPEKKDNLAEISGRQLQFIDTLHCKTIREEDKMSSRMASLQEAIADLPMKRGEVVGVSSDEVGHAVDAHCLSLAGMVRDADWLRLSTLKELMGILTPRQGVDLLAATKKLHLSLHEWGKRINHHSGEKGILLPE